uniref:CCHC-type domain-containing protein n=1 Tax=Takifugu rubripes TaxID=31033 RepID=A0A674NWD2_TAKRU
FLTNKCFRPVSNRGPFACEANVITTTLRKPGEDSFRKFRHRNTRWGRRREAVGFSPHLAQAIETACKDVKDLQSPEFVPQYMRAPQAVHKVYSKQTPYTQQNQRKVCYRCGSDQHMAGDCRFIKETCHKCGKVGHIQKVCRFKGSAKNLRAKGGGVQTGKQGRAQGANYYTNCYKRRQGGIGVMLNKLLLTSQRN